MDVAVAGPLQLRIFLREKRANNAVGIDPRRRRRSRRHRRSNAARLWSHSHKMLTRISPVAMSSMRYRTSSSPKKSAGFSAAA